MNRTRGWSNLGLRWLLALMALAALAVIGWAARKKGEPWRVVGTLCFVVVFLLLMVMWVLTVWKLRTAKPLKPWMRLWDAFVFVAFVSVVGTLIWGWRCHPEWPIWHWTEPAKKEPLQPAEEPDEADEPAGPMHVVKS
jgi:hypothetical protein